MTGLVDAVDPNAKGLLETSAAVVPLGVAPKPNAGGAAGTAVAVVEEPKVKLVVGFSAVEDGPNENGLVAGFSSDGAMLVRCPNENGVAGGGVPNSDLGASAVGGAVTGEGVDVDVVVGAG